MCIAITDQQVQVRTFLACASHFKIRTLSVSGGEIHLLKYPASQDVPKDSACKDFFKN